MTKIFKTQQFEEAPIRQVWDSEKEEYYFSVVDIIAVLTESKDPNGYWRKLKQRLKKEGNQSVTNCHRLKLKSRDDKNYFADVATQEQVLRLIQSIPSPKAEPLKMWLAQVGAERIDEMIDPERAVHRGIDYYRKKGYSEAWIEERKKGIDARNTLTDEWKRSKVKDKQFAILTNIITSGWSDMSVSEYKSLKGLKKENLRDHFSRTETALNTLAEVATTELSKKHNPQNFEQNKAIAKGGGKVAKTARIELEKQLGRSIITSANAKELQAQEQSKLIENE